MSECVLITYATAFGSTADIAIMLSEKLSERGFAVDVKSIEEDPTLSGYDRVLVGSAVQHGTWLPTAVEFVKQHQAELARVPVALFSVHVQNQGDDAASTQHRLAYLDAVRPYVEPVDTAFFGGRFTRSAARDLLPRWLAFLTPPTNFVNKKKINAWAEGIFA
jgi:menaquinone-dependent protoporphyrinogen oxidase